MQTRPPEGETPLNPLRADFKAARARATIAFAYERFGARLAVVSSFGADSISLLHLTASVARDIPILFIDTQRHFPQTLAYAEDATRLLGLNLRRVSPSQAEIARLDPNSERASYDPDGCCDFRKTKPLDAALQGFDAWISGRKKFQSDIRADLDLVEADGTRVKINPLINWSAADLDRYRQIHDLPQHPLVAQGYPSIGCAPCTAQVKPGEDPRSGRWRGFAKTECGIHFINSGDGI